MHLAQECNIAVTWLYTLHAPNLALENCFCTQSRPQVEPGPAQEFRENLMNKPAHECSMATSIACTTAAERSYAGEVGVCAMCVGDARLDCTSKRISARLIAWLMRKSGSCCDADVNVDPAATDGDPWWCHT
jgi:hypothetical protein